MILHKVKILYIIFFQQNLKKNILQDFFLLEFLNSKIKLFCFSILKLINFAIILKFKIEKIYFELFI